MKSGRGIRIMLLFLILVIGSFDRHLSYYYPGEVKALIQAGDVPAHSDLPVNACDHHEDITIKAIFSIIPAPPEVPVINYRVVQLPVTRVSPHTVWQPPEVRA